MVIGTVIPQREDEANRVLARLSDGHMHLRFEMQRDTNNGDTIETFDIRIADAPGTRDDAAFRGGNAMRGNVAIRGARSRLLAHRAGARLETPVIDEGFGTFDADGRERFIATIPAMHHDVARMMVITHITEMNDRVPTIIDRRNTARGSR